MKYMSMLALSGLMALAASTSAVVADTPSQLSSRVLPVLVHVNAHGKVTEVLPAYNVHAKLQRLMRESLDQMIVKPAMYHGRAVATQFVVYLGLDVAPRAQGGYDAKFAYKGSSPVPSGNWYWVHDKYNGDRLALANYDEYNREPSIRRVDPPPRPHSDNPDPITQPPQSPPTQSASMSAAPAAAPRSFMRRH